MMLLSAKCSMKSGWVTKQTASHLRRVAFVILCLSTVATTALAGDSPGAALLRAKQVELGPRMSHHHFAKSLYVDSNETPNHLSADIYAEVSHPFEVVKQALTVTENWCDVLILHVYVKYCRPVESATDRKRLAVHIGKKEYQELNQTYRFDFGYRVPQAAADYFDIIIDADKGPLGTSDYRLRVEGVALPGNRSFLHLSYSYTYNLTGKLAMQGYLFTAGSGKVGFTERGRTPEGESLLMDGSRGVIERNTMRYYLSIEAYLAELPLPTGAQLERRLLRWFASTEEFSRQLHDQDLASYLDTKRLEYRRQVDGASP